MKTTLIIGNHTAERLRREKWLVLDKGNTIYCMSTNQNEASAFANGHQNSAYFRVVHSSEFDIEIV